ncbi:hypothetical protein PMIN01_03709 [Paraphaeosphaeria minitans]|uniref:Secreted protein n=1 Tax=Paraphaeosphaeria minitans TaxID=565426 RepID=A0A9P6GMM1_9PLEO|nr:hypothetical protein PMIN01_03709 [Paraphaeosphaeria minitans]
MRAHCIVLALSLSVPLAFDLPANEKIVVFAPSSASHRTHVTEHSSHNVAFHNLPRELIRRTCTKNGRKCKKDQARAVLWQ